MLLEMFFLEESPCRPLGFAILPQNRFACLSVLAALPNTGAPRVLSSARASDFALSLEKF